MSAVSSGAIGTDRFAAINERMREFIGSKEIAGAVTLVATKDRVIHVDAVGLADIAGNKPMKIDSLFWIASMTKPITGTAVMMLAEEGRLSIDDPVSKYIPELANLRTADGMVRTVTIKHLLTHSSGMGEISSDDARNCTKLADVIPYFAARPLAFEPGTRWSYCQSGINTAARIVEIVSGRSFPEFVEKRLFKPLGMRDTTFYLTEKQLPRLAKSYARTAAGRLEDAQIGFLLGKSPTDLNRYPLANGGLFSTAADYARFCRMILNGGTLDGKRYLKAETVEKMTTVQSGDLQTGFTPGNGWGLGWCVVREPQGITSMFAPGACGHGGAYGTQAWIDKGKGRIYILMVQRSNFPNSDASDVRKAFQQAAADALDRM